MRIARGFSALAAVVVAAGCYRYVPETATQPSVGAVYRAHLTPAGSVALERVLGRDVVSFDANVLSINDSLLTIAMEQTVTRSQPRPIVWSGEQMTIGRNTIQSYERRELDRARSMRFAALYAVGGVVAARLWLSIRGNVSGEGPSGPGPISP